MSLSDKLEYDDYDFTDETDSVLKSAKLMVIYHIQDSLKQLRVIKELNTITKDNEPYINYLYKVLSLINNGDENLVDAGDDNNHML